MTRPALALLLALTMLGASCVRHHRIVVTGRQLHHSYEELRDKGRARVDATDYGGGDEGESVTVLLTRDQRLTQGKRSLYLKDLLPGCPVLPPFDSDAVSGRDCPLVQLRDEPLFVRSYDTREVGPFVRATAGGLALATLLAATACGLACQEGSTERHIAAGTAIGTVGGLVVWILVSCSGRWGKPGCRD